MAYTEEYRELIDNADSAIRALLAESREEAFIGLRAGLGELWQALEDEEARDRLERLQERAAALRERIRERAAAAAPRDDGSREREERWERNKAWRRASMAYKEGLIIEAIGDDQLRPAAVVERMNEALGWAANPCVPSSSVESLMRRLLASGQLDRLQLPVGGGVCWHYFRKRGLTGPIADLERAYRDDGGAVA